MNFCQKKVVSHSEKAKAILGEVLLTKLQSIGMYDFNEVSNSHETKTL